MPNGALGLLLYQALVERRADEKTKIGIYCLASFAFLFLFLSLSSLWEQLEGSTGDSSQSLNSATTRTTGQMESLYLVLVHRYGIKARAIGRFLIL